MSAIEHPDVMRRQRRPAPGPGRRLRIAFLSNANSLHLQEWSEHLATRLGHEVTVLTIPPLARPYPDSVRVVELGQRHTNKVLWPLLIPRIRRELARARADLLVGYRVVSYGFLGALAGFRPLVLAAQGGHLTWPPDARVGGACVRFAVRRAARLHAWSHEMKQAMIRFGADPGRIVVLSRGIDLSLFPWKRDRQPGPPMIAMTRSLLPSYNTKQLVAAMPYVLREVPEATCLIAGDGPLLESLTKQAARLGVADSVRFLGRLSRAQVIELLGQAHVYCSTTVTDGLPLSHFEAMASGLVPVCTDIAANRGWIRHGENGFLAPVADAPALAEGIIRAIKDDAFRERAAAHNRAVVERHHDRDRNLRLMALGWERLVGAHAD